MSRVADVEAELTVAEGTAGLQRRRRDGLGTTAVNGGGALACEQRGGGGKEVCRCTNEGGGRGWARLRAQVAEGEVVASSTRDVGAESAARAARGGGYAKTRVLTARAREQRERGKRARIRGRQPR